MARWPAAEQRCCTTAALFERFSAGKSFEKTPAGLQQCCNVAALFGNDEEALICVDKQTSARTRAKLVFANSGSSGGDDAATRRSTGTMVGIPHGCRAPAPGGLYWSRVDAGLGAVAEHSRRTAPR